jgi:hypothetical protein
MISGAFSPAGKLYRFGFGMVSPKIWSKIHTRNTRVWQADSDVQAQETTCFGHYNTSGAGGSYASKS